MAGKFYPSNPAKFMGTMTLAYGAAQILAPVCTGYLTETFGSYDIGLYVSAAIVMIGTLFLFGLFRIEINTSEKKDIDTQTRFLIG